jgi:hypothetical protein
MLGLEKKNIILFNFQQNTIGTRIRRISCQTIVQGRTKQIALNSSSKPATFILLICHCIILKKNMTLEVTWNKGSIHTTINSCQTSETSKLNSVTIPFG